MVSKPSRQPARAYKVIRQYNRRAHHSLLLRKLHMQNLREQLDLHPRDASGHRDADAIDRATLFSRWNAWRFRYKGRPDLRDSNFTMTALTYVDLTGTDLSGVEFIRATLAGSHFQQADLSGAELQGAHIVSCNFEEANLSGAKLMGAYISGTCLARANLSGADLTGAVLIDCDFKGADLSNCNIYGISAWDLDLTGAVQSDLVITPPDEPMITVDNLEVAQFVYLLLRSEKLRDVLDTLTSKVVLILGRFTVERKAVLDAVREKLRSHGYLPVLFDFEKPANRDLTETVTTLAHLSRFVIADLTDPKSVPHELASIVPTLAVPIQPIITGDSQPYAMFEDFQRKYRWVLDTYYYHDLDALLADLNSKVIAPAEQRLLELAQR